jgi:hypothetical protein
MFSEITYPQAARALNDVTVDAQQLADRYIRAVDMNFVSRMDGALGEFEDILDEFPDSNVIDASQAERIHECLTDLAALCLAQVAIVAAKYPAVLGGA